MYVWYMVWDVSRGHVPGRVCCHAHAVCADYGEAFCLACLLPPAIWTRFCSATYFIGILGVINQQIEVKLITYDLSIKLRAM